jgi:hypothetical protein
MSVPDGSTGKETSESLRRGGTAPGAPAVSDSHVDIQRRLAPGTLLAGRYRIILLRGVGGVGVV